MTLPETLDRLPDGLEQARHTTWAAVLDERLDATLVKGARAREKGR